MNREDWVWYIVVDHDGSILEGFNSFTGAETWRDERNDGGGHIVKVKEAE